MKILVTGATGFIGSAFAKLAVTRGHEIGGMMLPTENPPAHVPVNDRMVWIKGTLADLPWRDIETFRPDACIHFAWIATPGVYLESPENEKHLEWGLNLTRRLKGIGMGQFVGVGTCIEYKITNAPLNEGRTPVDPTTLYSRCKNTLRETLEAEARKDGSHFCWGRVFYPYGVGEHPARLCSSLIQKFRRGEKLVLKTPHSTKDYIYIDDLAAAILLTVEKKFQGTINWGTGVGVSVRQIADAAAALVGRPELVEEISPPEIDPLGYVVADNSRLRQLGWRQQVEILQGLKQLANQELSIRSS
jgi:dTDP-6-deoxy-L-talose 4-dehydrogenase (NAD+)